MDLLQEYLGIPLPESMQAYMQYYQTLQPYLTTFLNNFTSTFNIPSSSFGGTNRNNNNRNANINPDMIPSFIPGMLRHALSSFSPFASVPSTIFDAILSNMGLPASSSSTSRASRSRGGGGGRRADDAATEKLVDYQTIIIMLVTGYISLRVMNVVRRWVMSWVWMLVKLAFWLLLLGLGAVWVTNGNVVHDVLSLFIGTNAGGGVGGGRGRTAGNDDARWQNQARRNGNR